VLEMREPTKEPVVSARVKTWVVRMVWERGWSSSYGVWGKKRDMVVVLVCSR